MTSRSTSLVTFTIAALIGSWGSSGCWTGAESQGLPCTSNTHCGLGLDCINGFCGGEPSLALCGNGYVDPGEACDLGEQNAEDGACRPDCTLETCGDGVQGPSEACDLGAQNDDAGACKTDCTPERCGDGFVGPTEACDDGNTEAGDGCSPTCTFENCGNGIIDQGEGCDDGGESPTCNANCTLAACGDLVVNAAAGEECDNASPPADDRLCMSNCTVPLLWDDMEPDTPPAAWTHGTVSGGVPDTWLRTDRNQRADSTRGWDSGLPSDTPGDIRLMTPELELSVIDGAVVEGFELRFKHARWFRDCNKPLIPYEGAVVEVSVDGGAYQVITPTTGYPGVVGSGLCEDDVLNPLNGELGYILDADHTTEIFDLSAFAGSTIKVGFRAAWDCGNCVGEYDQSDRGWFIDDVVVSRRSF